MYGVDGAKVPHSIGKGIKQTVRANHMSRPFARILLEITDVRVQRLQDISEDDAREEGVVPDIVAAYQQQLAYRAGFMSLWLAIHGAGAWDANPWVWVITFRRVAE